MKHPLLLCLAILLTACGTKKNSTSTIDSTATVTKGKTPDPVDTTSVDLTILKAKGVLATLQAVTIPDDPVYHSRKTYQAVPLATILTRLPGYAHADPATTLVVFECSDGYAPTMLLADVRSQPAFLAVRDGKAPAGQDWVLLEQAGRKKSPAPFYVVWPSVSPKDDHFKWPYNLVRIKLAPAGRELAVLHPAGAPDEGYQLFKANCLSCHAFNGLGGKMGPELNYPKNITEYWKEEDIRAFVRNPASYRHGVRMPAIAPAQVSEEELTKIMAYLRFMANHKVHS